MDQKILGIDLCDQYTTVCYYGDERSWTYKTVICKNKSEDGWTIGEQAYAKALSGIGVMTDKLVTLASKHGIATINGIRYGGIDILKVFLKSIIDECAEKSELGYPDSIVLTVPKIDQDIVGDFKTIFIELGYGKDSIHIISRSESFIYYCMSQPKEVWNNQVGLFNLSDISLSYYELRVVRSGKNTIVYADTEDMDEGFNLEILSNAPGAKLADKILTACADRLLKKKLFSAILLTGEGFEDTSWAPDFMKFICARRRVYADKDLFARGATIRGLDLSMPKPVFNIMCVCDGRLDTSVSMMIDKHDKEMAFPIARVGDTWYDTESTLRVLPDNAGDIELSIVPMDAKKRKIVRLPLNFIPPRPAKTMRVDLHVYFTDSKTMIVELSDAGFGDLFKSSNTSIKQEVHLWD